MEKIKTMSEQEMISEASKALLSLETEIKTAYAEALELAATAKDNAREAVIRMADCGQLIIVAKDQVKGNKSTWLKSIGIDAEKASKAVYLAKNRDQLMLDLWPSDVAKLGAQMVGILPPPCSMSRSEDDPERTNVPSTNWLSYVGKLQRSFKDLFDRKPIIEWRPDEKENVKFALKPLVELYTRLG